jgi:hypothetical protein
MAVQLARRVDYPMLDNANIAYFPRIYDLAHRFFEECWEPMCGTSYPEMIDVRRIGFPVVHVSNLTSSLRCAMGILFDATIWLQKDWLIHPALGAMNSTIQDKHSAMALHPKSLFVLI